jgi:hypothetical protein
MLGTNSDVMGWIKWLTNNQTIGSKLSDASNSNVEAYFLSIHAATEAIFRRILLIGLRLNKVTYSEASEWLYHNDNTPDRSKYPCLFNQLYQSKQITWSGVIGSIPGLDKLWDLWLDYSKMLRNHISHGIRKYKDDWLQYAIKIDQELLVRLNQAMTTIIGGSICSDLKKLNPRLPIGLKGSDLNKITGRKGNTRAKPSISLTDAKNKFVQLPPRIF